MKHIYTFTLLLLIPLFSLAQSNYKPGYVVNLKGDTLRGLINYHEWDRNPKDIRFKKGSGDGNTENFSIKDAAAFAVTGQEYYERFILPVSQDPLDLAKLGAKTAVPYITDTVFLKVINKGKYLTLYGYVDDIKPRFYLMGAGEAYPQELGYHAYYNADESSTVKYDYGYRTQLQQAAEKYNMATGQMIGQITRANYTEAELVKIVQTINGNSSPQFTTEKLSGTRWFAGVGINYSKLEFVKTKSTDFESDKTVSKNSIFPRLAAGADIFINKSTQSLILRVELSFTANQYKVSIADNDNTPSSTSTLDFKQYNPSITPQIIYNLYNKDELKIFVGAGASLNFSLYNHYAYITKYDNSSFQDVVQNNYPELNKFWIAVPLRTGMVLNKKLEINICYTPPASILNDNVSSLLQGHITSYQAGVNYFFGK